MKLITKNESQATAIGISLVSFVLAAGALYFSVSAHSAVWTGLSVNTDGRDLGELADLGSALMTESELENKIEAIMERGALSDMDSAEYDRMMAKDYEREGILPASGTQPSATTSSKIAPETDNVDVLFKVAQSIPLKDVNGTGILSQAWLGVYNGVTYHRVAAKGLPILSGTDYYEGWLVRDPAAPLDLFSTGKMKYDPAAQSATLSVRASEVESGFRTVYVTREGDDGDPAPGEIVLSGAFAPETDLTITDQMIGAYTEKNAGNSTQSLIESMLKNNLSGKDDSRVLSDAMYGSSLGGLMQLLQGNKK